MKTLDWKAKEAYAKTLSLQELSFALQDCIETAKAFRLREEEGYYHDEASVYRAEIERRTKR